MLTPTFVTVKYACDTIENEQHFVAKIDVFDNYFEFMNFFGALR